MHNLVFCDIDSVLNIKGDYDHFAETNTIRPELMDRLNSILINTAAHLVVTSAWRYVVHNGWMTLNGFDYLLRSHGLGARCLKGVTRKDGGPLATKNGMTYPECDRNQQIHDWFRDNPMIASFTGRYIILDDINFEGFDSNVPQRKFIQTDPLIGLSQQNADDAIRFLNEGI